jgi:branched-chain amino acid transport system permease protein
MVGYYSSHIVLFQSFAINLLIALSIQFPLRLGVFSFAGVGSFGIGAYSTAIAVHTLHWSTVPAIMLGVVMSSLVGLGLAFMLVRLDGLYLAMATIAFDLIISVVATNGGALTGGPSGLFGIIAHPQLAMWAVFVVLALILALFAVSERGALNRRIWAVSTDSDLARSLGIRVSAYRVGAFVVSAFVGGLSGAVNVLFRTTIGPDDVNFSLVVLALTIIIVGGVMSWVGAFIGAAVFTWLPQVLATAAQWQGVVYGVFVALAAIWLPGGLVGTWVKARRAWVRRRAPSRPVGGEDTTDAELRNVTRLLGAADAGRGVDHD